MPAKRTINFAAKAAITGCVLARFLCNETAQWVAGGRWVWEPRPAPLQVRGRQLNLLGARSASMTISRPGCPDQPGLADRDDTVTS